MPGMRAWRSCAVSMVVSAIHPARGFFPSYLRGSADMFRVIHGRQARSTLLCNGAYSRELQQVPWKHGRISAPAYRRARRNVPRFSTSTPTDSAKGPEVVDDEEHEWSSAKVRQAFVDYFAEKRGHTVFPSSPVVPVNDPSLLFANAGMNQFKTIFLGQVDPSSPLADLRRAVNSQKCIRAGGKHNDLDDVGKDVYHHTFFEMLGTWSFGDYFKKEAIEWGFDALTDGAFRLPVDRLYATYFGGDEALGLPPDLESRDLWRQFLPEERVLPGSRKDNFWEMGEVGPCGPCSELHYDRIGGRNAASLVNKDDPDVLEIWNLVFIQFNRDESGVLKRLPAVHVDTGMGLERLVSVLQDKRSNYDTDVFQSLFDIIRRVSGAAPYGGRVGADDGDLRDTAYRIVADHARALTFAIADGAVPSNEGRGYVLRRILRRAVRYGQQTLGAPPGFFGSIVPEVVSKFGEVYPELKEKEAFVVEVIKEEEEAFSSMLERGIKHLKEVEAEQRGKSSTWIPGDTAFFLYDTLGFPLDLTQLMAEEVGMTVDAEGFESEMATQKLRSKQAEAARRAADSGMKTMVLGAEETSRLAAAGIAPTDDNGKYSTLSGAPAKVVALFDGEALATSAADTAGSVSSDAEVHPSVGIVLDATSFYSEAGGQVADRGHLEVVVSTDGNGGEVVATVEVADVRMFGGFALHMGRLVSGSLAVGDEVRCQVNYDHRDRLRENHTMTHVLNFALRKVLGTDADQKGSLVTDQKLRFDFGHGKALTGSQLEETEAIVQKVIDEERDVFTEILPLSVAKSIYGLRAVFGEVYPDPVRVVSVGFPVEELVRDPSREEWGSSSVEFCGGTHLDNTRDAKAFVIAEEGAVAKGIRRITALTGTLAERALADGKALEERAVSISELSGPKLEQGLGEFRREIDDATVSAAVKGRLRAQGEKLQKKVAAEAKAAAALAAEDGVNAAVKAAKQAAERGETILVMEVMIGANSKAVKRVLDAVAKAAPGMSFMGFSAEGPGPTGKLLVFNSVVGAAAEGGLKADEWLRASLEACGGRGGGRATSAQGQAASAADMHKGIEAAKQFVA